MFDWNDEELTNIIWGEAGEGEDHIVPYSDARQENPPDLYGDQIKKQQNQKAVDIKPSEQKKSIPQTNMHGVQIEGSSQYLAQEGLEKTESSVDSWPTISIPCTAKSKQDPSDMEASNDVPEISKHESVNDDKAGLHDNASEIFHSPLEESEKGDFLDYSWATVGSFEDLDRIFSNDDPIFGHASLGNTDELWSSSKDITRPDSSLSLSVDSPNLGIGAPRGTSEQFEVKAEHLSDQNQPSGPSYEKMDLFTSNASGDSNSSIENIQCTGGKNKLSMKQKTAMEMFRNSPVVDLPIDSRSMASSKENIDKRNLQKKSLKGQKKWEENSEIRHLQDLHGSWTHTGNQYIQYGSQFAPAVGQPSPIVFGQHLQFQGPESSKYQNFPSPMTSLMHGNIAKQYAPLPVLSQFPSMEGSLQPVPSTYAVPPGNLSNLNKSAAATSLEMTPQEKIEKLRRRQQMRAMLAIQKQQQQFGNQVSSTEYSVMEGENIEAEETLPVLDPSSSIEQDDSNTSCRVPDDFPVQESILYRLQEITGKLDIRIRLCIRDSLFRLAQSATQRQYAGDTSNNKCSKDEVLRKDVTSSHKRFSKAHAVETETNPVDRTIAHLLFHRPLELSGKPNETSDSPLSVPHERKATGSMNLATKILPQKRENNQILPRDELNTPIILADGDQMKNSPCLNASDNTIAKRVSADGKLKVEPPSES